MKKLFFIFLLSLFCSLEGGIYFDEQNECIFTVFEKCQYEQGKGNVRIITKSPYNFELTLSVYPEHSTFVPLIYDGADLTEVIDEIKNLDPAMNKFIFKGFEVQRESDDKTDESRHILLNWETEESGVIQDVICNNGKWYVITCNSPLLGGEIPQIARDYLSLEVDLFLTDLDMRHITRHLKKGYEEALRLGIPKRALPPLPEYPTKEMLEDRVNFDKSFWDWLSGS